MIATVLKGAEIERRRIETLASAERQTADFEAEGHASAIRAQGEAEAEIIFKKGEAEAKAMNVKAEAYQEYNQAAVIDKLITEHARDRESAGGAAAERRQDHDRFDRRRYGRDEQNNGRPDEDGRADPRAVRDSLGHADVRTVPKVKAIGDGTENEASAQSSRKETIMALMERVGTLLRANLNDLVDRAEDPEKMLKQIILDMENQLMQVKTQVAISLADLHLLERRRDENTQERRGLDAQSRARRREENRTIWRARRSNDLSKPASWPKVSTSRSPIRRCRSTI